MKKETGRNKLVTVAMLQNCSRLNVHSAMTFSYKDVTVLQHAISCLKANIVMLYTRDHERIEYKLLSLTYKVLTTSQPDYLHNLISVQSTGRTRSSSLVTLLRPSVSSSQSAR